MSMKTTEIDINLLRENPDNPRKITEKDMKRLIESVQKFPRMLYLRPIVADADHIVLGGNMRLRAAKAAGFTTVPVLYAEDLTEEEKREFIIKDNLGYGEWDWEKLVSDWPEITDWGVKVPTMYLPKTEILEDDFKIPKTINTTIQPGDLITIDGHRLLCGDSTKAADMAKLFEGQPPADLVHTDPPYNVDYTGGTGMKIANDKMGEQNFLHFLSEAFSRMFDHTKPGGAIYVWHAESTSVHFRNGFVGAGWSLKQCLIWVKTALVMGRQDYQWRHEPCLYGWKPGAAHYFTDERIHTTVIEDDLDLKKMGKKELIQLVQDMIKEPRPTTVLHHDKPTVNDLHPTMKPVKLCAELIRNSTKPGEIVLDAFLGSGSTMVAAHQLARRTFGVELDPKFCQVIVDRMRQLDPEVKVTRNGAKF